MEKKPYHHGNLESALIEAGLSLVDKEGIEGMTLRRVAAACGVSHAAPYKHFSGKEDMLAAMQRYVADRFATALEDAYNQAKNRPDPMLRMGQAYLEFFTQNPHYFSFFQREQSSYCVNLNDLREESSYRPFEVFKQAAIKDMQHLSLPDYVQHHTVIAMWAMVHGCTSIAVMSGVVYDGDWSELLGSILQYNMGAGGSHFGKKNEQG